jgi:hypothetical protein
MKQPKEPLKNKPSKVKPKTEAKTSEPSAVASRKSIEQDEKARVVASEPELPAQPVYLPNGPTVEKDDTLYRIGSIKIDEEPINDEAYREAMELILEEPAHGINSLDKLPKFRKLNFLTDSLINLENGGTVSLEIHCDLFNAGKNDRDFIDALVELTQAYENKKSKDREEL